MTAPRCHGTWGGCYLTMAHDQHHTDDCPTMQARVAPFTPPTKRTMGQCHGAIAGCTGYPGVFPMSHGPDCPALYPLQRQPGDEKDALTRLTALIRVRHPYAPFPRQRDSMAEDTLELISEAREEHKEGMDSLARALREVAATRDRLSDDLTSAKALVTTLTLQQTEMRQQAFRDMAAEMAAYSTDDERNLHLCRILAATKESD